MLDGEHGNPLGFRIARQLDSRLHSRFDSLRSLMHFTAPALNVSKSSIAATRTARSKRTSTYSLGATLSGAPRRLVATVTRKDGGLAAQPLRGIFFVSALRGEGDDLFNELTNQRRLVLVAARFMFDALFLIVAAKRDRVDADCSFVAKKRRRVEFHADGVRLER